MSKRPARDIYQEVTDKIVGYLEQGVAPWRNPVNRSSGDGWPKNLASGKRYRGINLFLLAMQSWTAGYSTDFWMTYKQAKNAGGADRKGEKGALVAFWKLYETNDKETAEPVSVPVLKHYTAFNLIQIEGIDPPDATVVDPEAEPFVPLVSADQIVDNYDHPPIIEHAGSRAFYRPGSDRVCLPKPDRFQHRDAYYCTLFHELSHSTGHRSRLDRGLNPELAPFGSPDYSREELIAELSAAFLCAAAGISPPTVKQSAVYLKGWIDRLRGDKRLNISAADAGQKSADWILGERFTDAVSNDSQASLTPVTDTEYRKLPPEGPVSLAFPICIDLPIGRHSCLITVDIILDATLLFDIRPQTVVS